MLNNFLSMDLGVKIILGSIFLLIALWILVVKGYALWTSARMNHKWWFVILLVVNTFGLLELAYLFLVAKIGKKPEDASSSSSMTQ